jgi:hypothetical protein
VVKASHLEMKAPATASRPQAKSMRMPCALRLSSVCLTSVAEPVKKLTDASPLCAQLRTTRANEWSGVQRKGARVRYRVGVVLAESGTATLGQARAVGPQQVLDKASPHACARLVSAQLVINAHTAHERTIELFRMT